MNVINEVMTLLKMRAGHNKTNRQDNITISVLKHMRWGEGGGGVKIT